MGAPNIDVLVAGGGPVGLAAAHELARRGVRVRLVDKAAGPAVTSRATATHARALEVYHQMGILDDVMSRGQKCDNFTVHSGGKVRTTLHTDFSGLPTRFPFTLQVDQVIAEEVMRDHLRALGVEVEWNVALEAHTQKEDRVEVRLVRADGTAEEVTAGWLIGADGAHSVVRKQLGLQLLGESSETWLVADAVVDSDLPRNSLHWMHTGNGTIMLVPFPAPGKWRLLDTVDVSGADDPDLVAARFARKIAAGLGRAVKVHTPTWVSVFTIRQRMIQSMRNGRCFVAGDAAHVHSPASGQGMNTGVQDAHNLGWKLADVIRGHASEALLDSYSAERVPIGEKLLSSTRTATALVALKNIATPVVLPIGTGLLNAMKPVKRMVERKVQRTMSGLALDYTASPLTLAGDVAGTAPGCRVGCTLDTEQRSVGWQAMCAEFTDPRWTLLGLPSSEDDVTTLKRVDSAYHSAISVRCIGETGPYPLRDPDGALCRDLGLTGGMCAIVRPDGYLAAKGPLSGVGSLLDALHLLGGSRAVAE